MKVEFDLSDIKEFLINEYCYEDNYASEYDIAKGIINITLDKASDKILNQCIYNPSSLIDAINKLISDNSQEIIERVISMVTEKILLKKAIAEEMPKKKDIADISKEWEDYFVSLIDKAIAKRFK